VSRLRGEYTCRSSSSDRAFNSGVVFPLVSANKLADYIIGTSLETVDIEAEIQDVEDDIANLVLEGTENVEDVAKRLHTKLQAEGKTMNTFTVENVYKDTEVSQRNIDAWYSAEDLASGWQLVQKVRLGLLSAPVWHLTGCALHLGRGTPSLGRVPHSRHTPGGYTGKGRYIYASGSPFSVGSKQPALTCSSNSRL
jgi:hypothetical protein